MWLFPLSFFTYQFVLRLLPSLLMQQIMQNFSIDATAFGLLAAVYYYGYAGMQIPIGIMLDKYCPKYVIFISASVCGLATYLFSITDNWHVALISRFLIGAGSAVGFLSTSKVISQWFDNKHYGKMISVTFTIGLLGSIYGGKPVSLLIERYGISSIAKILSFVGLLLLYYLIFF
jgi:sugar phosphate permease